MKLSIIIVNYNGQRFFDGCLKSIAEHVPFEHEVIVVDNASTDGSAEYLRSTYPKIRLIESESNLGFSGGNNLGARSAKGEYLLLLNNDTLILDDLSLAIDLMERDASIGALGARMLGKDREYRYSAGYFPEPWRLIKFSLLYRQCGDFRLGTFPEKIDFYPVDWVEGSFLLTPTEVWRKLGGLDEKYFMYVEDIDYARNVVDLGKRVVYCPKMSYVHFGGFNQTRLGMLVEGFRKYHRKHSGWSKKFLAFFVLDIGLIVRSIAYLGYSIVAPRKLARVSLYLRALRRMS